MNLCMIGMEDFYPALIAQPLDRLNVYRPFEARIHADYASMFRDAYDRNSQNGFALIRMKDESTGSVFACELKIEQVTADSHPLYGEQAVIHFAPAVEDEDKANMFYVITLIRDALDMNVVSFTWRIGTNNRVVATIADNKRAANVGFSFPVSQLAAFTPCQVEQIVGELAERLGRISYLAKGRV